MKFDRQLRPATETSWVVSYSGKTISRWRTAAILKIVISPYLSEKLSDFDEILYTQQQILNCMNVTWSKMKKNCIGQTPSSTERISCLPISRYISQTIQDSAIVTTEGEYELVCNLSNGAISSDLERTLILFLRSHHFLTLNISQTATDTAIVTIEGEQETAPKLSNGTRFNDREWPLSQISRLRYYSTSNNSQTVQDRAIFTKAD